MGRLFFSPMSFTGTIVSHDHSLHTGLILPDGEPKAIAFTEGDVMNWTGTFSLFGQRASFHVVETPAGLAAIQMVLLDARPPRPRFSLKPGRWTATFVACLMLALAVHLSMRFLHMPIEFAILFSTNVLSLILFPLVANSIPEGRLNPAEAVLLLMAFCGGAPTILLLTVLLRTRLRTEGSLALLFALVLIQLIGFKRYYPALLDFKLWKIYLMFADLSQ